MPRPISYAVFCLKKKTSKPDSSSDRSRLPCQPQRHPAEETPVHVVDLKASVRQGQEYRLSSARAKIGARVQLTGVFVVINEGWRGEGFVRKEDGLTARRSGIDRPWLHSA